MYEKLDKLRAEVDRFRARLEDDKIKLKKAEDRLREAENTQILSDVGSYNLTPEQLAQFLQLANSGKLQEMLNGKVEMPGAENLGTAGVSFEPDRATDVSRDLENEEDYDED